MQLVIWVVLNWVAVLHLNRSEHKFRYYSGGADIFNSQSYPLATSLERISTWYYQVDHRLAAFITC